MGAITKWRFVGLFAHAEILRAGFWRVPMHGREFAFLLVAAITKGLVFGLSTGAPPVILARFNRHSHGLAPRNMSTTHVIPPPEVLLQASQQALANSRTARIYFCLSVTEITPRASSKLKAWEALMHWS